MKIVFKVIWFRSNVLAKWQVMQINENFFYFYNIFLYNKLTVRIGLTNLLF